MMSFSIPFNRVLLYRGGGTYMDLGTVPHQVLTYVLDINSIPIGGADYAHNIDLSPPMFLTVRRHYFM